MRDTTITVVGNIVDDPIRRRVGDGTSVTTFRVGSSTRFLDKATGEWRDGRAFFITVTAWRALGDRVFDAFQKGDPVVVQGAVATRTYEKEGQRRQTYELDAYAVGPNMARTDVKVLRRDRSVRQWTTEEDELAALGGAAEPGLEPGGSDDPDEVVDEEREVVGAGVGHLAAV